jgi:hypothetical protein
MLNRYTSFQKNLVLSEQCYPNRYFRLDLRIYLQLTKTKKIPKLTPKIQLTVINYTLI